VLEDSYSQPLHPLLSTIVGFGPKIHGTDGEPANATWKLGKSAGNGSELPAFLNEGLIVTVEMERQLQNTTGSPRGLLSPKRDLRYMAFYRGVGQMR
jgi:hypothetical protein